MQTVDYCFDHANEWVTTIYGPIVSALGLQSAFYMYIAPSRIIFLEELALFCFAESFVPLLESSATVHIQNKPSESSGHSTQLRGMASTLRMHVHSHIARVVAAMDSCFVLVRTHQQGIAPGREPNKVQQIICPLLPRRMQTALLIKRQLHIDKCGSCGCNHTRQS